MAEYVNIRTEITEIPAPDDFIQGSYVYDLVTLGTPGNYKRGMLLMSGDGGFVPATSAGSASAEELCIAAESISFTEGTSGIAAYFSGTFNANRLILSWEQEGDNHSELIDAIRPSLRKHRLFLN